MEHAANADPPELSARKDSTQHWYVCVKASTSDRYIQCGGLASRRLLSASGNSRSSLPTRLTCRRLPCHAWTALRGAVSTCT